ncbi:MAG: hypothetical protein IPK52_23075 [Chloroflexi bacterium]|nr:hypothetical protein [Chloroflexota bacterium]
MNRVWICDCENSRVS